MRWARPSRNQQTAREPNTDFDEIAEMESQPTRPFDPSIHAPFSSEGEAQRAEYKLDALAVF